MKTVTKVSADVDGLLFGYWDTVTAQFIPVDAQQEDELKRAASDLQCSEELLDALATFAANISQMVGDDLRSIWRQVVG